MRSAWPPGRAARGWLLLAALALLLQLACASYSTRLRPLRATVSRGELTEALALVEKNGEPGQLLYHLERGTLLHHLQRFAESNQEFERAAEVYADRYTVSLSQRGMTFLLNDEVEAYSGEIYEGNYLHYYRILNFLALGDPDGAAVEARRLAQRLTELRDREDRDPDERGDPFLEYLTGVALESIGEWNSALIAYRRAREEYAIWERDLGLSAPPWLGDDIVRTARRSGIDPREIGIAAEEAVGEWPRDRAQLIVVLEQGWPPHKVSEHLRIPIFKRDESARDAGQAQVAGLHLADRYQYHRAHGTWSDGPYELAYFLDVALPVLATEPRDGGRRGRVCVYALVGDSLETDAGNPRSAEGARAGRDRRRPEISSRPIANQTAVPAADLGRVVERTFAREESGILAKTFARALLKYAAHRQVEKQWGTLAGVLTNIAGAATEKADTRGWLLLPGEVGIARLDLPAGRYRVSLEATDSRGTPLESTERQIELAPGGIGLVSWRSFR